MPKFYLLLSGEHKTLPYGEYRACLEAGGFRYNVICEDDMLAIFESVSDPCNILSRRMAYLKICGNLLVFQRLEDKINLPYLLDISRNLDWSRILEDFNSFHVRAHIIRKYHDLSSLEVERRIGEIIYRSSRKRVSFNPNSAVIDVIVSRRTVALGLRKRKVNRGSFNLRRPRRRPFFHPSAMDPITARVMVNLSRVSIGDLLLDPFCGTGSILIEGGLIGCKILGGDINPIMVKGCRLNLEYYGLRNYVLIVHDARKRAFTKVDSIVTDPPYGRLTSTPRFKVPELIWEFMAAAREMLREGKFLVISVPLGIPLDEYACEIGFKLHEVHEIRLHRALTRRIMVLRAE